MKDKENLEIVIYTRVTRRNFGFIIMQRAKLDMSFSEFVRRAVWYKRNLIRISESMAA